MADDTQGGPPKEHPGVTKVKKMFEDGDFDTIDRMVDFWEAMESLGKLGDLMRRFIIWVGAIAAAYFALSGTLTEWIRSIR